MALVKTSALIADISGNAGGGTFAKQRAGLCLKARSARCDPQSSKQLTQRARFATANRAWSALSTTNRNAWIATAKNYPTKNRVGDLRYPQPQTLFIGWYLECLQAGLTPSGAPPSPYMAPPLSALGLYVSHAGSVGILGLTAPTTTAPYITVYGYRSFGKPAYATPTKWTWIYSGAAPAYASFLQLVTQWTAALGMPATGEVVWAKAHAIATPTYTMNSPALCTRFVTVA